MPPTRMHCTRAVAVPKRCQEEPMTISHVLKQIFLPQEVRADKTARVMSAHSTEAVARIRQLLRYIDNRCAGYGLGCGGNKAMLAKHQLDTFARRHDGQSLSVDEARLVLSNVKYLKRGLKRELPTAMLNAGRHPSWYKDGAVSISNAVDLARKLQNFRPSSTH